MSVLYILDFYAQHATCFLENEADFLTSPDGVMWPMLYSYYNSKCPLQFAAYITMVICASSSVTLAVSKGINYDYVYSNGHSVNS
jgi:hypothetical protein